MSTHDVVITGMGVASPCGVGCEAMWNNLRSGKSGIAPLSNLPPGEWPTNFGGEVRDLDPQPFLKRHCPTQRDRCVQLGIVAAVEALEQSNLLDAEQFAVGETPIATVLGSGAGPSYEIEHVIKTYHTSGARGIRPTSVPKCMFNAPSSLLSIYFGLRGPNHIIASACASGVSALGQAYSMIKSGMESVVLTGGMESTFTPTIFASWSNMRVLAKHEDPTLACRPFDKHRNGLVLAEGAGMVVLESREHAEGRGATILGSMIGYGASSDAHHITAPQKEGQTMAVRRALADAGIGPDEIDYINAHGTSTKSNDEIEAHAIREIFGDRGRSLPVSSTKSMLGHSLGATGALEFVASVLALRDQFVPPTINCEQPDPDIGLDFVPCEGRPHAMEVAMSNSFAFGGNNSVVLVRRESR